MNAVTRGRFITLEGGEGVGKSTQLKGLAEALRRRGKHVVETREPGGSPGAESIRTLLLHADPDAWSPQTEALLFAAARTDHVQKIILPALEAGHWVLCDRFIDSTRAYQGGGSGIPDVDILELHRIGCGGLMPDKTLLMELGGQEANARRATRKLARADRFEERDPDFHAAVELAFLRLADAEPERIVKVDASGEPPLVTERLIVALQDWL